MEKCYRDSEFRTAIQKLDICSNEVVQKIIQAEVGVSIK